MPVDVVVMGMVMVIVIVIMAVMIMAVIVAAVVMMMSVTVMAMTVIMLRPLARQGFAGQPLADLGRAHDNLYEVALWSDMLKVEGDELFYAYMVDNQAIVIPETVDAIRALIGRVRDPHESIAKTNAALGIGAIFDALGGR